MAEPDWTENDRLVVRTDNGLRAGDEALPQPPQDPDVVLDARGIVVAG
jgi:hypothetical protein